jgi:hypothetical protein
MELLLGMFMLDKVFGDGDLLGNAVSGIFLFIGMILYFIAMWKVVGYIDTNLSGYFPVIAASVIGLTYMIPKFNDQSNFIRALIFKLLVIANIGICFIMYFSIVNILGEGIATFTNNYTFVPISKLLVETGFPFTLLGGALMIISSLLATVLDLIILPFTLIPFIQRIVWRIMAVNL